MVARPSSQDKVREGKEDIEGREDVEEREEIDGREEIEGRKERGEWGYRGQRRLRRGKSWRIDND